MPTGIYQRKVKYIIFLNLCECGCNEVVYGNRRYIVGHNARIDPPMRREVVREKISKMFSGSGNPNYGVIPTKETREKIGKANKGKCAGDKNPSKRPEVRKKISKGLEGRIVSIETRLKIRNSEIGKEGLNGERNPMYGKRGKLSPAWKGGKSFEDYPQEFNFPFKEKIRNRDNRMCQLCGIKENGEKLSVHHIDYIKINTTYENCISLCRSCNAIVNGNRKYYKELFEEILKIK